MKTSSTWSVWQTPVGKTRRASQTASRTPQGNELWDFSLVDPDNRRPVDYKLRREMLASLEGAAPEELLRNWPDGRIKMFLTQRLLRLRRVQPALFLHGSYIALETSGAHAESCLAFAREHEGRWMIVLAPRLASRVGFPPVGELWRDTAVELPATARRSGDALVAGSSRGALAALCGLDWFPGPRCFRHRHSVGHVLPQAKKTPEQ